MQPRCAGAGAPRRGLGRGGAQGRGAPPSPQRSAQHPPRPGAGARGEARRRGLAGGSSGRAFVGPKEWWCEKGGVPLSRPTPEQRRLRRRARGDCETAHGRTATRGRSVKRRTLEDFRHKKNPTEERGTLKSYHRPGVYTAPKRTDDLANARCRLQRACEFAQNGKAARVLINLPYPKLRPSSSAANHVAHSPRVLIDHAQRRRAVMDTGVGTTSAAVWTVFGAAGDHPLRPSSHPSQSAQPAAGRTPARQPTPPDPPAPLTSCVCHTAVTPRAPQ